MIRPLVISIFFLGIGTGCTLFATRPVQEMSDAAAALRAAREVQADILSADRYRRATELFFKARREYKFKNFSDAKKLADQARLLAEEAEFEAQLGGATREDASGYGDPFLESPSAAAPRAAPIKAPPSPAVPYAYPTPEPTPVDVYDQRKQERLQRERESRSQSTLGFPAAGSNIVPSQGAPAGTGRPISPPIGSP